MLALFVLLSLSLSLSLSRSRSTRKPRGASAGERGRQLFRELSQRGVELNQALKTFRSGLWGVGVRFGLGGLRVCAVLVCLGTPPVWHMAPKSVQGARS